MFRSAPSFDRAASRRARAQRIAENARHTRRERLRRRDEARSHEGDPATRRAPDGRQRLPPELRGDLRQARRRGDALLPKGADPGGEGGPGRCEVSSSTSTAAQNLVLDAVRAERNALLGAFDVLRAVRLPSAFFVPTDAEFDAAGRQVVNGERTISPENRHGGHSPTSIRRPISLIEPLNLLDTGSRRSRRTRRGIFVRGALAGLACSERSSTAFDRLTDTNERASTPRRPYGGTERQSPKIGLDSLEEMTPFSAAMAAGAEAAERWTDPVVAWEYWNGRRWSVARRWPARPRARTFRSDGPVTFTVPDDIEPHDAQRRRRALDPRPPNVRAATASCASSPGRTRHRRSSTSSRSSSTARRHSRWSDSATRGARGSRFRSTASRTTTSGTPTGPRTPRARGDAFEPFTPVDDRTPALYLGLRPRAAGRRRRHVPRHRRRSSATPMVRHSRGSTTTARRGAHVRVSGRDSPARAAGNGDVLWPGVPPLPAAMVDFGAGDARARAGRRVRPTRSRLAMSCGSPEPTARRAGRRRVDRAETRSPSRPRRWANSTTRATIGYSDAPSLRHAAHVAARTPHHRRGAAPSVVRGISANAVWASQLQTIENETLGSGNGQSRAGVLRTQRSRARG